MTVHRLVQAVARARSETKELASGAMAHLVERLLTIYPDDGFGQTRSWPISAQLTPHVLALWKTAPERILPELLRRVGNYLHWRATYTQAKSLLSAALTRYEASQEADPERLTVYLIDFAGVLWDEGNLLEAQPLFERALRINEI